MPLDALRAADCEHVAEFGREFTGEHARASFDAARALLTAPEITAKDVARPLGIGPSTSYGVLPVAKYAVQGAGA